jgi:Flp pilus assembly protein protease CpaA
MIEFVPLLAFLGLLGYISIVDIKYRMIPYWTIPVLFILAPIYIFLAELSFTQASFSFTILLVTFLFLFVIGRGSFGIGDVIVMAVIGWVIADIGNVYVYLINIFAPCLALWFVGNIIYHWHKNKETFSFKDFFQFRKKVHTSKLLPGMVLSHDNFMHGLTEPEIKEMQKKDEEIEIKQPMAFIPVSFISLSVYYIWLYSVLF